MFDIDKMSQDELLYLRNKIENRLGKFKFVEAKKAFDKVLEALKEFEEVCPDGYIFETESGERWNIDKNTIAYEIE